MYCIRIKLLHQRAHPLLSVVPHNWLLRAVMGLPLSLFVLGTRLTRHQCNHCRFVSVPQGRTHDRKLILRYLRSCQALL